LSISKKLKINLAKGIIKQKAIAQILSDMDEELQALRRKREKMVGVKEGMMQELLTGKTRLV
jgi:type I restriction enzyme S subunit